MIIKYLYSAEFRCVTNNSNKAYEVTVDVNGTLRTRYGSVAAMINGGGNTSEKSFASVAEALRAARATSNTRERHGYTRWTASTPSLDQLLNAEQVRSRPPAKPRAVIDLSKKIKKPAGWPEFVVF